jgi:hypothetical protein
MKTKYDLEVTPETLYKNIKKIINLTYKLLPMREEGSDWSKLLETLLEELVGMNRLLIDLQPRLFPIICKMEGLFSLTEDSDMSLYRRVIFECLGLLSKVYEDGSFK